MNNRETGQIAENMAADHLTKKGFTILYRNYRTRYGEIDIIALTGKILVFVEVKSKRGLSYGYPREAVGINKQNKIKQIANYFIVKENMIHHDARFDVVEVYLDNDTNQTSIELYENAFE